MTNLLTRRLALFRIASVAGAASVAAAPTVMAAVQTKQTESRELVSLAQEVIDRANRCEKLKAIREEARAEVMSAWPSVPETLLAKAHDRWLGYEKVEDCDHKLLWPDLTKSPPRYHSVWNLTDKLENLPKRGGSELEKYQRQTVKRLLPIAKAYERDCKAACDAQDYETKVCEHEYAEWNVLEIMYEVAKIPSLTPDGITLKAQAYQACVAFGKEGKFQAAIHLGPSIAEDVCRVLSEGEEA
jgi:hypothetical protein